MNLLLPAYLLRGWRVNSLHVSRNAFRISGRSAGYRL
jgi:hypothetical protein